MATAEARYARIVATGKTTPLGGRLVANAKRELVIGRRSHGHVALYRYVPEIDTMSVLAIRSQREAGYYERDPAG